MDNETLNNKNQSLKTSIISGIIAGLIAAFVMAIVAMTRNAVVGLGFWLPMRLISGLFYGVDGLVAGAGAIIVGIIIHFATGALYGAVFGAFVGNRFSVGAALVLGIVYGIIIWAIMTWLILPWANGTMYNRVMVAPGWWFGYHIIYGGILLLTPLVAKKS